MNHRGFHSRAHVVCATLVSICMATLALANEPPTPAQVAQYKADGTWARRLANAYAIGNHKAAPGMAEYANWRIEQLVRRAAGLPETLEPPPARQGGLPTSGSPNVLVLLVEFPDYPHYANQTQADVDDKFFQDGAGNYPYESVHNYFDRASYGALDIQGNVLGWYTAAHNRSYYEALGMGYGQEALFMEALDYFNAQGHDFTQYDNDGNGTLDSVYLKYTGPDTGWSGFWWAYKYTWWANPSYTIDGKYLDTYVFGWIANPEDDDYDQHTDIHETGHALGLPDYYDYDDTVGPDGGLGGLDMQHDNVGDWNCFSKFLVDWITPTTIVAGSQTLTLNPSGTSQDCVLIMPGVTPGEIFDEYFMVQYRKASTGNDPADYPTGFAIWHVDSTLDGTGNDWLYDNSYTDHKLLRRMEADGLEEIETGDGDADAGDFYVPPSVFGPLTTPNSDDYTDTATNVVVYELSEPGTTMTANFGLFGAASAGSTLVDEDCDPANAAIDPGETVTVSFTLENVGGASTTNLVATLLATGGVTSPSGPGSYGAIASGATASQNFTFTATGNCGDTLTATLELQDGTDVYAPVTYTFELGELRLSEDFDGVTAPALPTGWVATRPVGTVALWATTTSDAYTSPNAAYTDDPDESSDNRLTSESVTIETAGAQLAFRHQYGFDDGYDGGRLEISIDGGSFEDILDAGGSFVSGAYTTTLPTGYSNPLEGEQVWSGSSGGFIETVVDLPAAAVGYSVQFRWRMGSDYTVGDAGWWVDSVRILHDNTCCESVIGACCHPGGTCDLTTEANCSDDWLGAGTTCDECNQIGDLNCDGSINNFDIDPFVLTLTDVPSYQAAYPNCDYMLADINNDGSVNNFDIDPFVDLLTGP